MFKEMMKKRNKNNKGFTLVELIVVIAILAILVGLLAPQYTKYVERSRKATDVSNADEFIKAVQVGAIDGKIDAGEGTITINTSETEVGGALKTSIEDSLKEVLGEDYAKIKLKSKNWDNDTVLLSFTVENTGAVKVKITPADFEKYFKDAEANDSTEG